LQEISCTSRQARPTCDDYQPNKNNQQFHKITYRNFSHQQFHKITYTKNVYKENYEKENSVAENPQHKI
jgi:hypothetical protein